MNKETSTQATLGNLRNMDLGIDKVIAKYIHTSVWAEEACNSLIDTNK
jgi:hypothetical protein